MADLGTESDATPQPCAIRPIYSATKHNETIVLYDGVLEVQTIKGVSARQGKLTFAWQPRVTIHIEAKLEFNHSLMSWDEFRASFRLPNVGQFTNIDVETAGTETGGSEGSYGYILGSSVGLLRGAPPAIQKVIFSVPNFTSFAGSTIWYDNEESPVSNSGRATIQHPDWRIVLDTMYGYNYFRERELQRSSAHAITHVGEITRPDYSSFTPAEVIQLIQRLSYWLSFIRGNWTAPILSRGFSSDGSLVWDDWRSHRVEATLPINSWADPNQLECYELSFAGFCQRYEEVGWNEPIELAVTWYVECCRQKSGVEAAIILSQNGLELLGWSYLVDEMKCWPPKSFENFTGPRKIRELLQHCDIPIKIPAQLVNLTVFARQKRWADGPMCLVYIRNTLIHSRNKNYEFSANIPDQVKQEIWTLGLWYLELVLLRIFKYTGKYSNRLNQPSRRQPSCEQVPWGNSPLL